jgi:hypothetical protein
MVRLLSISEKQLVTNLSGLRDRIGAGARVPSADVAAAFGWNVDQVRQREIAVGDTILDVGRGFLGVQPAALFATPLNRNGVNPLNGAALYGYHAAVRWGLLIDQQGLTAFNSHWLMQDHWFSMPTVGWYEIEEESAFLNAFRPERLADGEPDRLALQRYPNPSLLQPVDDELVDRLDAWRDEALKSSKTHLGVDGHLQTLFAKLFVLRTIEDRGLASTVTPLSAAIDKRSRLNIESLITTFEQARKYIGSELFDNVQLDVIPEHVVSGIINDLYVPKRLPHVGSRYNFAWIDSDVLGLAYEKYLSTVLQPLPPAPQMDLFREAHRDVARISVRRAGGVYYTPSYLTNYLSRKCIDEFFDVADAAAIPRIVDFSCGSGSFLVAAVDVLLTRLKALDPDRNWGKELIEGGYINGVDVDEKAVTVASRSGNPPPLVGLPIWQCQHWLKEAAKARSIFN